MEDNYFNDREIEKRNLNAISKSGKDFLEKNGDKEIISIVYADTLDTLYYDVSGLSEDDLKLFIESILYKLTQGCNYNREVIKQCSNIYFIY